MTTPRVKIGDEVRVVGTGGAGRTHSLGVWGDVVAVDETGRNAEVLFQKRRRNARGAFIAERKWYPISALWTREDEREARR